MTGTVGISRNITKRKEAEEKLRESEERLQLALKGADLGLWDWDLRTGKATRDERSAAIYGYTLAEMEPTFDMWVSAIHPADKPEVLDNFNKHLAGSTPFYDAEYRIVAKSGETKWVLARGKVSERDRDGKPLRVSGTLLDIGDRKRAEEALRKAKDELELKVQERTAELRTMNEDLLREVAERKAAEQALSESEERYRSVFDNAAVGINLKSLNGTFLEVNQALVDMLGYDRDELSRLSYLDITHPEDAQISGEMHATLKRGDLDAYRIEKRYIGKDGRVIWVDTSVRALRDSFGKLVYTVGIIADITARRAAENSLQEQIEIQRALLSSIPAYVYFKDKDSVYITGNKLFSELSGIPENEILGKTDYDFFSQADADTFRRDDAEIIAAGKAKLNYEVKGTDPKGNTIWYSTSKSPFLGSSGEIAGLVGICLDITESKRSQEALL